MIRTAIFGALLACYIPVLASENDNLLLDPSLELVLKDEATDGVWLVKEFGHTFARDAHIKHDGEVSIRVTSGATPRGSSLRQVISTTSVRKRGHRFSGWVKTEALQGAAMLSVIVERSNGQRYLDWMQDRQVAGNTGWTSLSLNIPQFDDAESVSVSALVTGTGTAWFDSLAFRPLDTDEELPTEVYDYIEAALDIMERHSIVRDSVDWRSVRRKTRNAAIGAKQPKDAYPAIRYAVHMIGDSHSSFYSPSLRQALSGGQKQGGGPSVQRVARGQLLKARYGYIEVPAFRGTGTDRMSSYADRLHDLIESIDAEQSCGWIVDLRWNGGGNVFPMLAGIGPILGEGAAGGGITADGNRILRSYANGVSGPASVSRTPYVVIGALPPVAVLFGPKTGSSGEATALAFVGRPKTRTFGQPSGGMTTGNQLFSLADGAGINLAVTKMVDRIGIVYGGKIQPDVVINDDVQEDPTIDATVAAASAWLDAQCENSSVPAESPAR